MKKSGRETKRMAEKSEQTEDLFSHARLPSQLVTILCAVFISKLAYETVILRTELAFEAMNLNNTNVAEKDVLFFNRVPKVGSQTMMDLMKQLQVRYLRCQF